MSSLGEFISSFHNVGEFLETTLMEFHCLHDFIIKNLATIPDFSVYFMLG